MPLAPNNILRNRYQIHQVLAAGGFGAVYIALDTSLNRVCAIKENLDASGESRVQFEHEAQLIAQLKHPNLVQVFDYFTEPNGLQYLVMEFVRGDNLMTLVERDGALSEAQALVWIGEILEAVAYLHGHEPPIVHRDIKPGNIIITDAPSRFGSNNAGQEGAPVQKQAVLVDFGIAKTYVPGQRTSNAARAITPAFSPPEQYGQGTDPRSDLYALGATLYFILTGKPPAESIERLSHPTLLENPRSLNPNLAPNVEQVILRAMALKTEQRYATAREMRDALARSVPVGDRAPCLNCGKLNRPGGKFCSYCGNSLVARSPFQPAARPSIQGALQIPLSEGLGPAKAALFGEQSGTRIQNILNDILHRQFTTKGATFMLRGLRGCGMTRVAHAIRDELQHDKSANLVAILGLRERELDQEDIKMIQEFMWGLKQNSGPLSQKMSKTVTQYVQDYVHEREAEHDEREQNSELELSFPKLDLNVPFLNLPFGTLHLFDYKRKHSETRRPSAVAPVEKGDRGQVLVKALRELIDYLIAENARVVLIVDGIADLQQLRPLRPLTKMAQVFIISLVESKRLAEWQANPAYADLLSDFSREEFYLPCHWQLARELLRRMTQGKPEADVPAFERFVKYVQFCGAGLPDAIVRAVRPYYSEHRVLPQRSPLKPFPREEVSYTLQIPAEDQPLIFIAAEWDDFLNAHWADLFTSPNHTRIIGVEATDAAKVATYQLCHWLLKQAQNGQHVSMAQVLEYATGQGGFTENNRWIATNVVEWMKRDGLASIDRQERLNFDMAFEG